MSIQLALEQNNYLHIDPNENSYADQTETTPLLVLSHKVKFVVFVPESHSDIIRNTIGNAGGGIIGNYKNCSFSTVGTARFTECHTDSAQSNNTVIKVTEEKIETVVHVKLLNELIQKVREVHPYKKMGYDIIPLCEHKIISRL